jgi:hypothetical protein
MCKIRGILTNGSFRVLEIYLTCCSCYCYCREEGSWVLVLLLVLASGKSEELLDRGMIENKLNLKVLSVAQFNNRQCFRKSISSFSCKFLCFVEFYNLFMIFLWSFIGFLDRFYRLYLVVALINNNKFSSFISLGRSEKIHQELLGWR